jgi:hypothetical protein
MQSELASKVDTRCKKNFLHNVFFFRFRRIRGTFEKEAGRASDIISSKSQYKRCMRFTGYQIKYYYFYLMFLDIEDVNKALSEVSEELVSRVGLNQFRDALAE